MVPSIYNNLPECRHFQDRITRPKVLKLTTEYSFLVKSMLCVNQRLKLTPQQRLFKELGKDHGYCVTIYGEENGTDR